MKSSKDLFLQMREQEIITDNFLPTKKEIQQQSLFFIKNMVESGEENIQERYAQARCLKEAVDVIESELKKALPDENFEAYGIRATYRNGGSVANYSDDPIYEDIKNQLDNRKELLDTALKIDIPFYDSEGIEVPKVSKTERKSSLSVSF